MPKTPKTEGRSVSSYRPFYLFIAALVLLAAVNDRTLSAASGQMRVLSDAPPTEAPAEPDGENQATLADGSEICCQFSGTCSASGGPYVAGQAVTFNTYWTDTLPNPVPADWIVDWTLGVRLPSGTVFQIFSDESVRFDEVDDLLPGTVVRFCAAGIMRLPDACADGAMLTQGHGVTSPAGSLPVGPSDPLSEDDAFTCS